MILEFKVDNFLSIKDEQVLSFEATSDKHLEEYHTVEVKPGVKILKMAMIYGANASGKTNILKALDFLTDFAVIPREKEQSTGFIPFKFIENTNKNFGEKIIPPSGKFEIIFFVNLMKYEYKLELSSHRVISEKLYFYPTTQPAELFTRKYNENTDSYELKFGSKVKSKKMNDEILKTFTLENSSLISTISKFDIMFEMKKAKNHNFNVSNNDISKIDYIEIGNVFDFFRDTHVCFNKTNLLRNNIYQDIVEDPLYYKKFILEKLQKADFNIDNFEIINEKKGIKDNYKIRFRHKVTNGEYYLFDFEESVGTNMYFGLLVWLGRLNSINNVWAIDEFESSLHPELVNHFINTFLYQSKESHAQFVFTTHNIDLLDEDFVRKDIVWFTEKDEDGSTKLYSLSEFDIRKTLSFSKAYKTGSFGATPELDSVY